MKSNNLISSQVGSGHSGKYPYEMRIPMSTYQGGGTSRGKQFQLNLITSLIWFLFFKQQFLFSHMLTLFQGNFILGKATSSHFFRGTTSTQQLFFRRSYFFRTDAFFSFFRTVTFSQDFFFGIISYSEGNFYRAIIRFFVLQFHVITHVKK